MSDLDDLLHGIGRVRGPATPQDWSVDRLRYLPLAPDGCQYALHPEGGACILLAQHWVTLKAFLQLPSRVRSRARLFPATVSSYNRKRVAWR